MELLILILELTGTVAFAVSGAIIGLKKKMDIFGVMVLGLVTAVGGGILRDVVLGMTPPLTFTDPIYALTAIVTSVVVFVFASKRFFRVNHALYDKILLVMDSIGLGVFSASGVIIACDAGFADNVFLLLFVGTVTGVGGGVLRDLLAGEMPFILVKHIYAVAALLGAALCALLMLLSVDRAVAMLAVTITVVVIRLLCAHFKLNLPRYRDDIE